MKTQSYAIENRRRKLLPQHR